LVQAVTALPEVQFRYAGTVFNNRHDPVRFLQFVLRKAAHLFFLRHVRRRAILPPELRRDRARLAWQNCPSFPWCAP
jgi:hypothetical protein